MATRSHSTHSTTSNSIQMPGLSVEMQLSEIESIIETILFMHENAREEDRRRIMNMETGLLHIIRDKIASGQRDLMNIPGHYAGRLS